MALPIRTQMKYWGITAITMMVALWFLGDVILPFVLGATIAYVLDPTADKLEAMGCSRALSVAIISLAGLMIFTILLLLVIPTLIDQSIALFNSAPKYAREMQAFIERNFPQALEQESTIHKTLSSVAERIRDMGGKLLETLLASAASVLNVVTLLVIVPVVAVYLLYDWDRLVANVDELLPRDHAPVIRRLAREIDNTLASFIRGMGTVCLILGTYYALALMLVGLQFGMVVGAFAGLVTFIPYLGALMGGVLAIGLALFQFWGDWLSIGLVAGIFVLGQVAEGNFLTPKLVGSSIGLHPVWLIFALSAFGALFGFVGMLVAVPLAASIGVLARFVIAQYKDSRLYGGLDEPGDG